MCDVFEKSVGGGYKRKTINYKILKSPRRRHIATAGALIWIFN